MADFRALLAMGDADSAALSGVSAVAHRFDHGGEFPVQVLRGGPDAQVLAHAGPHAAMLSVNSARAALGAAPGGVQGVAPGGAMVLPVGIGQVPPYPVVPVDLATLVAGGAQGGMTLDIAPGQYMLFHAQAGDDPHAVVVGPPAGAGGAGGAGAGAAGFDSRQLGPGDLFSTVLVRPGTYALGNALGAASGRLTVAYPVVTPGTPYRPPEPIAIECGPAGFSPATAALMPGQGLVFHIDAPARIIISLTEPDDGPGGTARDGGDSRLPVDRER